MRLSLYCLTTLVIAFSHPAISAEFSDLYVFGDSLSDMGNLSAATFGLQPGDDYFRGRFSNGPVYAEVLADSLGIEDFRRSGDGGNNYAYGGGRTSGTSFFEGGFFIQDLDDQVDRFLDERTVDPEALYVVFAGSNDFVLGEQLNPQIPASRVVQEMGRLIAAGAVHLMAIEVPPLGATPRFVSESDRYNQLADEFNITLANGLDGFSEDVTVSLVGLNELLRQVVAVPSAFGFRNVVDSGQGVSDPSGYLFWDDIHPTREAHELLAEAALSLLRDDAVVGDFNLDGEYDSGDADLLAFGIANEWNSSQLDLDGDGALAPTDFEVLLGNAGRLNGDLNFDGAVAFDDFLRLAQNYGVASDPVLWSAGDLDFDGQVGFLDFLALARNYGATATIASVPEPGAMRYVLCATLLLFFHRHQSLSCQRTASR